MIRCTKREVGRLHIGLSSIQSAHMALTVVIEQLEGHDYEDEIEGVTFFDRDRFARDLSSLRDCLAFIPVEQVTKQDIADAVVNRATDLPEAAQDILDMVEAFRRYPATRQCETGDLFGELRPSGIAIRASLDSDIVCRSGGMFAITQAILNAGEPVEIGCGSYPYIWLTFPIEAPKGGVNG